MVAVMTSLEGAGLWIAQWLTLFGSQDVGLGRRETGGRGLV